MPVVADEEEEDDDYSVDDDEFDDEEGFEEGDEDDEEYDDEDEDEDEEGEGGPSNVDVLRDFYNVRGITRWGRVLAGMRTRPGRVCRDGAWWMVDGRARRRICAGRG